MMRPTISGLALSALVAGALSIGMVQAQTMQQNSTGTQTYGGTPLAAPQGMTGNAPGTMPGSSSAQRTTTQPATTQSGTMPSATASNVGPGIGPGTLGGVGPPTDGLDSNPYAEAPARTRKALGVGAHGKQSASTQRPAKPRTGSTLN